MSEKDEHAGKTGRVGQSDRSKLATQDEHTPKNRRSAGSEDRPEGRRNREPATAGGDLEAVVGDGVTVETETLSATLAGVPRVELAEFVYDHQLDRSHEGETHRLALFDIENTSDRPLRWQAGQTRFIGNDDYTYQPARLSLDPAKLGPGCHTRQVEISPGRRARVVTLVEQLPDGVDIVEVVHRLTSPRHGDSDRLVFSV